MIRQVVERLQSGKEPVRIVCFGDSITGVYYHTGGRRAWCDMLGIALGEVPPLSPSLCFTFSRLSQKQPVAMIVMPPYDRLMADALRQLYPDGQIEITAWPVAGASLAAIEQWAKGIRARKPTLVVIAVPADAQTAGDEEFIRSYNWVLDWSLSFGKQEWDVIAILPSVAKPHLAADEQPRASLARRIILGKDIGLVERPAGDQSAPEAILSRWIKDQHVAFTRPPK